MARKIIWTPLALEKRYQILGFWIEHNKPNSYSIKLNNLFKDAVKMRAQHPNIGRPTDIPNVRVKIVRDYWCSIFKVSRYKKRH
ncbi:MAG TPA: hypothetical protein PKL31_03620 [Fulvivirga sp.]|nr:hypothetical protein [Fulvivirga sp.]